MTPRPPRPATVSSFRCRGCAYELTRVRGPRCPECGRPFDPFRESTIARGETPLARWWHRQRHPDYGGFLPAAIASRLAAIGDGLGDVALGRGLLLPLLPAWIGIEAVLTRSTWLPGGRRYGLSTRRLELSGDEALLLGVAWLCLAGALHVAFVWGRATLSWRIAQPVAIGLGIAAAGGLVVVIAREFVTAFS